LLWRILSVNSKRWNVHLQRRGKVLVQGCISEFRRYAEGLKHFLPANAVLAEEGSLERTLGRYGAA
jgi:hypothetical protein